MKITTLQSNILLSIYGILLIIILYMLIDIVVESFQNTNNTNNTNNVKEMIEADIVRKDKLNNENINSNSNQNNNENINSNRNEIGNQIKTILLKDVIISKERIVDLPSVVKMDGNSNQIGNMLIISAFRINARKDENAFENSIGDIVSHIEDLIDNKMIDLDIDGTILDMKHDIKINRIEKYATVNVMIIVGF